ncbi:hypothetical protein EJ08DRAFT_691686 [Tothia fuscella]|uniref:GRF-type domain-containing protein n=1 Tax=Tothia fuscella TaxID=1048955 RepID=A0A9P4P1J1_9PEZI|nr:hypothetical protein EJ08DRAFT_691686 [Tothia fuscella]
MAARRGRGGGRGGWQGGRSNQLRGAFVDGTWQCDCSPRLPAVQFQVKKQTENQGKWFYTCQKAKGKQCGFFLFQDDAVRREQAAVLNNSRTEPRSTPNVLQNAHDFRGKTIKSEVRHESPPPSYSPPFSTPHSDNDRTNQQRIPMADSETEDEDGNFEWPLTAEQDQQAEIEAVAASTPRKSAKIDAFTTPGKQMHSRVDTTGLLTPSTGLASDRTHKTNIFGVIDDTSSKKRKADSAFLDLISPASTPTPARFKDVEGLGGSEDLSMDVIKAMKEQNIKLDDDTISAIRQACGRHARRAQGLAQGREVSRLALHARDAKIVELQHRVKTLEAELETQNAVVKYLRAANDGDSQG